MCRKSVGKLWRRVSSRFWVVVSISWVVPHDKRMKIE